MFSILAILIRSFIKIAKIELQLAKNSKNEQ